MATTRKPSAAAAVAVTALLMLVAVSVLLSPAEASTMTVFKGPECSGGSKDINGCGCFNIIDYQGGYHFVFTEGQEANLYRGANCGGRYPPTRLNKETRYCQYLGYWSVEMLCGTDHGMFFS